LRIEAGTDEYIQANAIGLFFVITGEVQLRLNLSGLRSYQNSLSRLWICTGSQNCYGCRR
jgi:hypothetical protein